MKQRRRIYYTEIQKALMWERWRKGDTLAQIARRGQPHGSGLGKVRSVVERTHAWLHAFRRLRTRFERRADIHEAFLKLACCLICRRTLQREESSF